MKTPDISVSETPGLREFLERDGTSVPMPDVRNAARDFLGTAGVGDSELGTQLVTLVEPSEFPIEGLGDWWEGFRDLFRPLSEVVVGSQIRDVEVGVYWVDVPHIQGCTGSLTVAAQNKTDVAATIKIAGVGGGGGFSVTLSNEIEIDPSMHPQLATVSMPFTFEHVEYRIGKRVTASFPRLVSVDKTRKRWTTDRMTATERPTPGRIVEEPSYEVRGGSPLSQKLTEKAGTSWELDLGVELNQIGVNCSLKLTGSYEQSVQLGYKLASGHTYNAVRYDNRPGYWWS
jgi:hypothetical protein